MSELTSGALAGFRILGSSPKTLLLRGSLCVLLAGLPLLIDLVVLRPMWNVLDDALWEQWSSCGVM